MLKFKLETFYNIRIIAHNNIGYKHTKESKLKINKPGNLNPMFFLEKYIAKKPNKDEEKNNKYTLGVGIFYLKANFYLKV